MDIWEHVTGIAWHYFSFEISIIPVYMMILCVKTIRLYSTAPPPSKSKYSGMLPLPFDFEQLKHIVQLGLFSIVVVFSFIGNAVYFSISSFSGGDFNTGYLCNPFVVMATVVSMGLVHPQRVYWLIGLGLSFQVLLTAAGIALISPSSPQPSFGLILAHGSAVQNAIDIGNLAAAAVLCAGMARRFAREGTAFTRGERAVEAPA
jgi:hypothetical protein